MAGTVLIALGTVFSGAAFAQENQQGQQGDRSSQDEGRRQVALAGGSDTAKSNAAQVLSLSEWNYDELYQGWSANALLDDRVVGPEGDDIIGDVENLLLNRQGEVVAVVAEVGGFWDINDTDVAVPWNRVEIVNGDEVRIPVTQATVQDYSIFNEKYFGKIDIGDITTIEDDAATGPDIWKASDLLNDYVVMQDGTAYGDVKDLIFDESGRLKAVVARSANADDFDYGYYAFPWLGWGYAYAWDPGLDYYALPYAKDQIAGLELFDYGRMK
jgi:sporulation protein YlmC with PRC-barrel domain